MEELLYRINQEELKLSELVEENNSLESNYIHQKVRYFNEDRPILLHNLLTEIENKTLEESPFTNLDLLNSMVQEYENEANQIINENQMMEAEVEQKRYELLNLLKQFKVKTPKVMIKKPDNNCSSDVENLARKIANEIEDVNEDQLIRYLARGREDDSNVSVLDKAKEFGLIKYNIAVAKRTKELMEELINKISKIDIEYKDQIDKQHENLIQAFDQANFDLKRIISEDNNSSIDDISIDENKWNNLEQIDLEMNNLRTRLLNTLNDKSIIQIPTELSNNEKEKESLLNCLNVLKESNSKLLLHLQDLAEKRVVDRQIYSEDEIRNLIKEYNELKLNE